MAHTVPSNVHVSEHPCLRAKLSQLRSHSTAARETKILINEIALIMGTQALAQLDVASSGTDQSPLGYEFEVETIMPSSIALVPILRSGLSMLDALQMILPFPVSVHHLGMYREKLTLQPVEYYNNLPGKNEGKPASLAILVDPIIATGATATAAIQTLREWGVGRIILISVLGALPGITKVAEEWPEGTEIFVGGLDEGVNEKGMIRPGLGDIGDRLYLTIGK